VITRAVKSGLTVEGTIEKIKEVVMSDTTPKKIMDVVSDIIGIKPKATVLVGSEVEVGASLEVVESKSKKWMLDGWSIDVFGGSKSIGVGVAKDLFDSEHIEVDAGVYATRPMKGLFDSGIKTEVRAGISARF
jgi:hypothetical protein